MLGAAVTSVLPAAVTQAGVQQIFRYEGAHVYFQLLVAMLKPNQAKPSHPKLKPSQAKAKPSCRDFYVKCCRDFYVRCCRDFSVPAAVTLAPGSVTALHS